MLAYFLSSIYRTFVWLKKWPISQNKPNLFESEGISMEQMKMVLCTRFIMQNSESGSIVREYRTSTSYEGSADDIEKGKRALKAGAERAKRYIEQMEAV
jgi:hypothetical protein